MNIDGHVHPALVDVAEQFRRLFRSRGDGGGALAVTLRGESVLDLWAGTRDLDEQLPWERDTLALSFSTTKGIAATVVHRLVDRGLVDVDATVASYWEDFGAEGKQTITVAEMLSHRAGLRARSLCPIGLFKLMCCGRFTDGMSLGIEWIAESRVILVFWGRGC